MNRLPPLQKPCSQLSLDWLTLCSLHLHRIDAEPAVLVAVAPEVIFAGADGGLPPTLCLSWDGDHEWLHSLGDTPGRYDLPDEPPHSQCRPPYHHAPDAVMSSQYVCLYNDLKK